jgi:hypothetical protein
MNRIQINKSYKKVDDMILYLAFKHKLPEKTIRNIVLGQFNYIRQGIVSGNLENYTLYQFGRFVFKKDFYPQTFQKVCEKDWYDYQRKQSKIPW